MKNKIKKYTLDEATGKMIENPCGGWFTAEDYYALQDKMMSMRCCVNCIGCPDVDYVKSKCIENNYQLWRK